jgi:hypothetical protein
MYIYKYIYIYNGQPKCFWNSGIAYGATLRIRSRTYSIDPAIVGSTGGWLLLNLPQFGRGIRFDILHGCEMCPLEANFQIREQLEVTRSDIRRVRWLGDDRNVYLVEELLHNKRRVARCVIEMQKPLSPPLSLNSKACT